MSSVKTFIASEAVKIIKEIIKEHMGREMGSIQYRDGGVFVSLLGDGKQMSAYWHPSKQHTASCVHTSIFGNEKIKQKAQSDPGYWAIAWCEAPLFGAKNYYNIK